MITQQNIVDRLNQLTIRYNLTWNDIKYDADKAINKINDFLGANFPLMSDVLLSPQSTYTARIDTIDTPFFPTVYIHSVVVPFIAMEVLARDEEFTTVYNKYSVEVEEGLFSMFQREFNRVPLAFRQNPINGVFFAADSALGVFRRNTDADLPIFKFRVLYYVNNPNIVFEHGLSFVEDTLTYSYGEIATLLGWSYEMYNMQHSEAYQFAGWVRAQYQVTENILQPGVTQEMKNDLHLFALWNKESVYLITNLGEVSIAAKFKNILVSIVVPDSINNIQVKRLASGFASGDTTSLFESVHFPKYITEVIANTFVGFIGHTIKFYENISGMPDITLRTNAFAGLQSVPQIIIPSHVKVIEANAFPARGSGMKTTIYCRILSENAPIGWATGWYDNSLDDYEIVWGYNG